MPLVAKPGSSLDLEATAIARSRLGTAVPWKNQIDAVSMHLSRSRALYFVTGLAAHIVEFSKATPLERSPGQQKKP